MKKKRKGNILNANNREMNHFFSPTTRTLDLRFVKLLSAFERVIAILGLQVFAHIVPSASNSFPSIIYL